MRTITTNLKKYRWVYSGKNIAILDRSSDQTVVLDKVGFMSLSRFILRSLDIMRIEEVKKLRLNLIKQKDANRENLKKIKEDKKALTQKLKKESRHSVGNHSQVESGGQV